ncbi:hypothetical protein HAX54_017280, partial [Datura stramonium]|nr:hypothetical protein [Datura stramonium]
PLYYLHDPYTCGHARCEKESSNYWHSMRGTPSFWRRCRGPNYGHVKFLPPLPGTKLRARHNTYFYTY